MVPLYNANGQPVNPTQPLTNVIVTDLNFAKGMEGAKNWSTKPNSRVPVFDQDDDVMYIIQTDMYNNKTITRKRFYDEPEPKPEDLFVTKQEFSELKGEINNVQLAIQQLIAATNASNESIEPEYTKPTTNSKHVQGSKGKRRSVGNPQQSGGQQSSGSEGNSGS